MKIIHLMVKEKFTKGVAGFYNEFFNNGEHEILYLLRYNMESLICRDLSICQKEHYHKGTQDLISYLEMQECDYIVIHSMLFTTKQMLSILLTKKSLLKKIVWLEWGMDLYSWKTSRSIKSIIRNHINHIFRNKIKNVICIFPPDVDIFKKMFPSSKAKVFYAPYSGFPIKKEFEIYNRTSKLEEALNNNDTIYIQVGQNAFPTLNHIETLKMLSKFKNENIKIILPLSYGGEKNYVDDVVNFAKNTFGDKVLILREFLPYNEYSQLLTKVSIAVFNTERQCGLGNIHLLNFRNVKLFLSGNGVMYSYFLSNGVPVQKYEDIKDMTFKEFIKVIKTDDKEKFDKYIYSLSNIDQSVCKWNDIWENLRKSVQ